MVIIVDILPADILLVDCAPNRLINDKYLVGGLEHEFYFLQ